MAVSAPRLLAAQRYTARLIPAGWPYPSSSRTPAPLRSGPIAEPSSLLRTPLPLCPASVLRLSWCPPLAPFPSHRDDRFSCSSSKSGPCSRHLHAGRQWGTMQVTPPPGTAAGTPPRFRRKLGHLDTSSTVHLHSTPRIAPDAVIAAPFPSTLTTRALYPNSSWRFESAPVCRLRGALPHLRQSIERCCTLFSHPTFVQDTR